MSTDDAAFLAALPGWSFAFVLVLARVSATVMLLPGLGETEVPTTVRAGLAVGLTLVILPLVIERLPSVPEGGLSALLLVVAEVGVGLWLGWLARMLVLALPMAGQLVAGVVGLANVIQPDAVLGPQNSALGRLFALAAPVAIMASGLHMLPLAGLEGSYHVLPPGLALPHDAVVQSVVAAVSGSFALALRLAAPFILAAIVWNLALGVLSRLVPQLQIYFAALPAQILGGLLLLGLLVGGAVATWLAAVRAGFSVLPGL